MVLSLPMSIETEKAELELENIFKGLFLFGNKIESLWAFANSTGSV